jgi:hypothetical protein
MFDILLDTQAVYTSRIRRTEAAVRPRTWTVVMGIASVLAAAGCTSAHDHSRGSQGTTAGCGMVSERALTGLLGADTRSATHGSLERLRTTGAPASCTTTVPGRSERFVTVRAVRHPEPLQLPRRACNAGWVYAGTPEKYGLACQESGPGGSRTVLLARWGEYVVRVTIGREDRNWAGDPEVALAITERVAGLLHVPGTGQIASGSPS